MIVAAFAAAACAFGLAACSGNESNEQTEWGNEYSFTAAYAEAQELGYAGTLDEFIEMISGKDGANGTNGKDGVTPHIGENGNWFIGETDTGVKAAGTNGADGTNGKDGINGTNGKDGKDGKGIKNIAVNSENEIVITWTDDTTSNIGKVPPCRHDFGEWETGIEKTCTSIGFNYRICSVCGYKDYDFKMGGHTEVVDEAVAATCAEVGLTEGKHCSVCNAVLVAQTEIPTFPHVWDDNGVCSGCNNELFEYTPTDEGRALSVQGSAYLNTLSDMEITIPATHNGLPVIYVGANSFTNCLALKSVKVSEGITNIYSHAFYGCTNLTSIDLPESVVGFSGYSFMNCQKLTKIVLPDGTRSISTSAFDGCSNLAFNYYDNAKYLGTADNPYYALIKAEYVGITSCEINGNTKIIAGAAFQNCYNLVNITIPDGVVRICGNAFRNCSNLTNVTISNTVERIDVYVFYGCNKLNYYVYENAYYLGNVQNPYFALVKLSAQENAICKIHPDTKVILSYAYSGTNITEAIIPDGVICVGSHMFRDCKQLQSVTMTDSVIAIHSNLFNGCSKLKSATISANTISIPDNLFNDCVSLETITFGGTMAQWTALKKGENWNNNTGNYVVVCSDGKLDKSGNVITE